MWNLALKGNPAKLVRKNATVRRRVRRRATGGESFPVAITFGAEASVEFFSVFRREPTELPLLGRGANLCAQESEIGVGGGRERDGPWSAREMSFVWVT